MTLKKLSVLLLSVCGLFGAATARTIELDYRAPKPSAGLKMAGADPAEALTSGTIRSYEVAARKCGDGILAEGDVLVVSLFDGVAFDIVLTARNESALVTSYLGAIDGTVCASVIPCADGFFVDIQDVANNRVYKILPGEATVRVRECDPSLLPKDDRSLSVPETALAQESEFEDVVSRSAAMLSAETVIDILVVYDQGAATWVKSHGGCDVFAEQAVAKANAALANTDLDQAFQFRLVACTNVPVTVSNLDAALDAVTEGQTGYEGVAALRAAAGADLVVHFIDTGSAYGTTGLGWSLRDEAQCRSGAFKAHAICACAVRSVDISHTMTHEIGHNMGAGHSDTQTSSPGPQLYDYSSGYYFTGTDNKSYHTIMAYGSDGRGGSYTECPLFSSPNHTYAGTVAGTAARHDNTRTIAQTYACTANYYPQTMPLTYGVTFSPESGAMFSDSLRVTIMAMQTGDTIYYTLDGTAPTVSNTRYTGPITVTEDTEIKAIAVDSLGNASRPFTARYSKSSLGHALNQPTLTWNTTAGAPWVAQTTNTHDKVSAAEFVGRNSQLWTTVTGPTRMSFWYSLRLVYGYLKVTLDDGAQTLFAHTKNIYHQDWTQVDVLIPVGTHKVMFDYLATGYYTDGAANFAAIDEIEFDAYAQKPVIHPEPAGEADYYDFRSSVEVSITAGEGQRIFYRTDGTDPIGLDEEEYTGPFTITRSTRVKAFATAIGKKDSLVVETLFRERHPIQPGEWTTDVEGSLAAADANGCNLTLTLCADLASCWYCQQFEPVAESAAFLAWARANKIYLITMDESRYCDTDEAEARFWNQWRALGRSGGVSYPTLTVADSSDTVIGWFLARAGQNCNGISYDGTVASLISVVASYLNQTPLAAPTVSQTAELVGSFPVTVTLGNPNSGGTIYYTLDGTVPTEKNGTRYTNGSITLTDSSQTLTAVVIPSGASTVTGIPLVKSYQTFGEALGVSAGVWNTSSDRPWIRDSSVVNGLRSPYVKGATYTATLTGVFSGKGKLIYTCTGSANTWQNSAKVTVDGTQVFYKRYDGSTTLESVITNTFSTAGNHTVVWSYTVGDPNYNYESNGCFLREVRWLPPQTDNPCPVPYAWLDQKFGAASRTEAEYQALADADSDGDGFSNWKEYLCGTDPLNTKDYFHATIRMEQGRPQVEWSHTNSAAAYQIQGSPTLPPVWGKPNAESQFFQVIISPR